jgi:hypothetical protein
MKKRKCNRCKKEILLTDFHRSKYGNEGRDRICKYCRNTYRNKLNKKGVPWHIRNKEYARNSYYKSHYNITLEQYDQMFEQQNGVCAICGEVNKNGWRLAVDHNHKTKKVRALLCLKCNALIGSMESFKPPLNKAVKYLRKHNGIRRLAETK